MNAQLNKQGITDAWGPHPLLKSIFGKKQGVFCWAWPEVNPIISMPWLLMTWWRKGPGHQQPWYWPNTTIIFQCTAYICLECCECMSTTRHMVHHEYTAESTWHHWCMISILIPKIYKWLSLHCCCHFQRLVGRKRLTRVRFPSLALSNLRLCSANHRPGYRSNLRCDWPSAAWAYSEQDTENGPRSWPESGESHNECIFFFFLSDISSMWLAKFHHDR